jgi:hypothetical protein
MNDLNNISVPYINVIKAFKNRPDVQDGKALGYRDNQDPNGLLRLENKPHSLGEGLNTTGFCVSASQSLIYDNAFKLLLESREARAKLISIDIKEQFFGNCYNGSKNTWHTAILVNDDGINFIIDITCGQFGNRYVNKNIWDFETWEKTFRSPVCKHMITDFENNNISTYNIKYFDASKTVCSNVSLDINETSLISSLNKFPKLNDKDINFLTNYFLREYDVLNMKLLNGVINKYDYKYISSLTELLTNLRVCTYNKIHYSIMKFDTKSLLLKYLERLENNDFQLNQYLLVFSDINNAKKFNGITAEINKTDISEKETHYLVIELNKEFEAIDGSFFMNGSAFIPLGTSIEPDSPNCIFNGINLLNKTLLVGQKTNTIYLRLKL